MQNASQTAITPEEARAALARKQQSKAEAAAVMSAVPVEVTRDLLAQKQARRGLLAMMRYCWRRPASPLIEGRHTTEIAARLDQALTDLQAGRSTYLIVTVPFRHGKSDLISRHFPPHALGINPDWEIILSTYGAELSEELSRDARSIFIGDEFKRLYPSLEIDKQAASVASWRVSGRRGGVTAVGIGGAVTGRGADILIVDDYCKSRQDAESAAIRDTTWEALTNNLMTRLAPAHIVIILATRWHVDDVIGRIQAAMTDPEGGFPRFEVLHYRARQDDGTYLFPERFGPEWYERQFATLGSYAASALLQGEPMVRGGNMIKTDRIQLVDSMPDDLLWVRFWDLASTVKERAKDDPDYTAGTRLAVRMVKDAASGLYLPLLYLGDCRFIQAEAPERNRLIVQTAMEDGPAVWQAVEGIAGYKDAGATLEDVLRGVSVVHRVESLSGDKTVRAAPIEPIFEAGNAIMLRAWWNEWLIRDLSNFPAGKHDDGTDSVSGGYPIARERWEQAHQYGANQAMGVTV